MTSLRLRVAHCALFATTALCFPSLAMAEEPAPKFTSVDDNGVDLTTGLVSFQIDEGGIGSGEGAMRMQRLWAQGAGWVDNWSGGLYRVTSGGVTRAYVRIAGISDTFTGSGSTWTAEKADGAKLTADSYGYYYYTSRDGTKIKFGNKSSDNTTYACPGADPATCQVPLSITRPNGLTFELTWEMDHICEEGIPGEPGCMNLRTFQRLDKIISSAGYSLNIGYASADPASADWFKRTSVAFSNSANLPTSAPTISYAYPSASVTDITDPAGRTWRMTTDSSGRLTGVRRPGSSSNNISFAYGANGLVSSATKDGVTTTYSRTVSGNTGTMAVTNELSQQSVVTSDLSIGRPTSFKDALNRTTSFTYDTSGRPTRTTAPEGNYVTLTYDSRGNVTQQRAVAKGATLTAIAVSASFETTCSNVIKCNKPTSTTDARGKVTDYTYSDTHGGVLTVTQPLPTATSTVRPQTRYSYTAVAGAGGESVYMLNRVSACQTTDSCVGTTDEAKATAVYNSNLLPTSISQGSGTATLATQAMTYDPSGNLLTVNGPLSGTGDTTSYRYDAADQLVGTISPDPDGTGGLAHRAVRITYRPDGQVSKQEVGTVAGQTDADWTAFSPLETLNLYYDSTSRVWLQRLSGGTTRFAQTELSYDALGRLQCSAVRMNGSAFLTYPGACTLGTEGTHGPDRITRLYYTAAGEHSKTVVGYGTPIAANAVTKLYTSNGKVSALIDGQNNRTTYEYDAHDRLLKTRYPDLTKGANTSSTTDFEQLIYDANGNVTSQILRDGSTVGLVYDALNRVTRRNLPTGSLDVDYGYDNLGRMTSAVQSGNNLSFTWDALGRNLTQDGPHGTATSTWDAAGRRTKLRYPDAALDVFYDYLVTGEMTKITEDGATSDPFVLATYAYDDLGRRTSRTFGNGVVQAFTYDPVSRLASLSNNLAGTANDLNVTFAHNPASQIKSTTRTGDSYAWTGHNDFGRNYTSNGLNQYTASGGVAFGYDPKGNLTTIGTDSFTYDILNRMTGATIAGATKTLAYDPLDRLYQTSGTATTKFGYDGLNLLAEYNSSGTLLRRYVHGPGTDEPLVQYEGTGTTDRSFMSSDERGSIISLTDSAGAVVATNSYDEYGIPASGNVGRFQYTGQTWLPETGMYYYKARLYSPTLGRFMQTDPIGYHDGMNLYAYVGNDPVNFTDPLGLTPDIVVTGYRLLKPIEPKSFGMGGAFGGMGMAGGGGEGGGAANPDIVVTANPPAPPPIGSSEEIVVTAQRLTLIAAQAPARPGGGSFGGGGAGGSWDDCGCLEMGTLVATPDGLVPIEQIAVGGLVLSVNERTGEVAPKRVTDLIRPEPKPLYRLSLRDPGGEPETFHATDDHPWKVEGRGWVETLHLKPGDRIDSGSGPDMTVTVLALTERVERTYNLTVADWHTFLVGEDGAVVHNACPPSLSEVWQGLKNWRGGIRRSGGRYYSYDRRHGEIEVFDSRGRHLGAIDAQTGVFIKGPVAGRTINVR